MANLISNEEKLAYQSAISDLHDTFGRAIVAYKKIKKRVSSLADENDDYDFVNDSNEGNEEFEYEIEEREFKARIKYIDKQEKDTSFINLVSQGTINLTQEFGVIRIKVDEAAYLYIKDCDGIKVDGNNTNILHRDRPHGLIDTQFYTFYLQRTP